MAGTGSGKPASQVSTSSSAITKWSTKMSAAVGGISGLLAVATGLIASIHKVLAIPATEALTGGGFLVLCATASALYARVDIAARERARAGRYTESADVPAARPDATDASAQPGSKISLPPILVEVFLALAASPGKVAVATKGHPELRTVAGIRRDFDEGVQIQLSDSDWIPVTQVVRWSSTPSAGR
jgi:hypothetical protein